MKPIGRLSLTALVALTATALIAASSAMAESTSLCSAMEEPCEFAHQFSHAHGETLSGGPGVLLTSAGNVLCQISFLGDVLTTLASPLVIHGHLSYSGCVRHKVFGGTEACTVTETSTDALLEISREGHELAKVTAHFEINLHCGSIVNCTYNGEDLVWHGLGPLLSTETNGQASLSQQTVHIVSGSFCPETEKLDMTITPILPTYISS